MPRVAVIIPTFEPKAYLTDALNSVLHQTHQDLAVVVVDDGSSTRVAEDVVARFAEMAAFPVLYVRQQNRGAGGARNRGLAASDSEFVAFLDHDDIFLPHKLEKQIALLHPRPRDYALVCGGVRMVAVGGRRVRDFVPASADGHEYRALAEGQLVLRTPLQTSLYRRECVDMIGGFDESLRNSQDFDLTMRLARRYRILTHPDIVCEYRKRANSNSTGDPNRSLPNVLRFIDKLEQDDPNLSPAILRRRRQRAWFAAARKHLITQGDFAAFRRTLNKGIERTGRPVSWRGWAALTLSRTGVLGAFLTRVWKRMNKMAG